MPLRRISRLALGLPSRVVRFAARQLVRWTPRELPILALIGSLFFAAALFDPYSTERPYSGEPSDRVPPGHLTLQGRLGYAILLRAGYGDVELAGPGVDVDSAAGKTGEVQATFHERAHSDLHCLGRPSSILATDHKKVSVRYLAMAMLAAEKYNRSSFTVWAEGQFARLALQIRGRLPDFSLGVAQVRSSTARAVLRDELGAFEMPDRDVLELLLNDCQNVRLAAKYVQSLARGFADSSDAERTVLRTVMAYNGSVTPTVQGLLYADAVRGAYDLLRGNGEEDFGQSVGGEAAPPTRRLCVTFSIGSDSGDNGIKDQKETSEEADSAKADSAKAPPESRRSADVRIVLWQRDPGPASYRSRLFAQRRKWLERELVAAGYSPDRIRAEEAPRTAPVPDVCEGSQLLESQAIITVPEEPRADAEPTSQPRRPSVTRRPRQQAPVRD